MRVKLDENMPVAAGNVLREAGHDVDTAIDEGLGGADDIRVLAAAAGSERVLFRLDRGFGHLAAVAQPHAGVVVFRPASPSISDVIVLIKRLLRLARARDLGGTLVVVGPATIRIRGRS